jgi:iron complex outermembrane receptor protein
MATTAMAAMIAASDAQAQDRTAASNTGTGAIESVTVTVERREQSLQDVDASVEAVSGDQLQNADVIGIDRLQQIAPGLRIGRSGSDPRPAMRGTFTSAIQGNNDPRFGFYVDEVYQSRTSQLSMPFVDLERVEVQKGPQGTLYGRNSFGGNIALTTATPKDDFDAGGEAIYGNYSRVMLDGFVNTPVTSDIDVRFAGQFEDRGGYINNIYNPAASADNKYQYYLRGSMKWVPHAWDDKLEVLLHASYWNEDDKGNGAFGSKTIGSLYDPSYQVAPGGTLTLPGGATVNLPGGYIGLNALSSQMIPYYIFYRDGVPDINGADVGIPIPGPYTLRTDYVSKQIIKNAEVSFDVNYDLNDWARLRSITAYTYFNAYRTRDADGTSAPKGIGFFLTKDKAFSQEFQIQSTSKGPLQYTFGVYYLHDEVPDGYIGEENRNYTTAGAVAAGQYAIYFNNYTYSPLVNYAAPLTSNIASNLITAARSDSINPLTFLTTDSGAVYGQVSYDVTDQLTLTGGIRYTEDHKKFASALQQGAVGGTLAFSPAYGVAPSLAFNHTCNGYTAGDPSSTATNVAQALLTACGERTFSFPTFRAAVDYKLTPENLLYASFNTGKHSGGFSYSPRPGATTLNPVDTENVQAFEVGSKNRFFDDHLQVNFDAYYNQYNSLQISVSYPNPLLAGSTSTYSQNGQSNVTPGFDLEILAHPTDAWNLNLAVNYMHARDNPVLVSGASSNNLCSIGTSASCPAIGIGLGGAILPNPVSNPSLFQLVSGTTATYNTLGFNQKARVQNQPDITFNVGSSYDFDLAQGGVVRAEWQTYFNGGYLLILNTPNYMQGAYTKTDLRVNYLWPDNHTTIQAFVENIENNAVINRVTFSNYTYDGNYEAPRTYGIRLAYKY